MNLETLNAIREQVDQRDDKGVYEIRLCFRCDVYFSHFTKEPKGIAHFYETVLSLIRDAVRWYDVDGKRRAEKDQAGGLRYDPLLGRDRGRRA